MQFASIEIFYSSFVTLPWIVVFVSLRHWPLFLNFLSLGGLSLRPYYFCPQLQLQKGMILIRSRSLFVLDLNKVDVNVFVSFSNALFFLAFVISSRTTNENRTHHSTEPLAATNL